MDAVIVLRRQGGGHRQRMRTLRRDRQDVGGQAGATARIEPGEHQHAGRHPVIFPSTGDEGDAAKRFGMRPAR